MHPTRILVWDLPTRLFHWSLAASFAVAYATGESEHYRDLHLLSGYLLLALIGFRLVWGIVGSRHARFANFLRGPEAVMNHLRALFSGTPEHHIGHNPAGAVAILLLLALGVGTGLTGWLTLSASEGDAYEELHETVANAMLALAAIHVFAVVVNSRLQRENLVGAMITGRKLGPAAAGISRAHGIIALLLAVALAAFAWGLSQGRLPALMGAAASADRPATTETRKHHHEDD